MRITNRHTDDKHQPHYERRMPFLTKTFFFVPFFPILPIRPPEDAMEKKRDWSRGRTGVSFWLAWSGNAAGKHRKDARRTHPHLPHSFA